MSEQPPKPKVSNKVSPLAVIAVVILIGILVVAFVNQHGQHRTPSGVSAPQAAQDNAVMPEQSKVPNGPAPMANTNDAIEATPTGNDVGNPGAGGIGNSTR
jgi:hypothetical protein